MTIFDFIAQILFKSKTSELTADDEAGFVPYIFNRWCSMYSAQICLICNQLGKYLQTFDNKRDLISLYTAVLPKVSAKRITYFKRKKVQLADDEENTNIKLLANAHELSTREIEAYFKLLNN